MDPSTHAAVKTLLQQWIVDRQQAFQEQLTEAWRTAQERLTPDEDLVSRLGACLALAAPVTVPAAIPAPPVGAGPDAELEAALDRLAAAPTQGEALKGLLEEAVRCAGRSAVYVVKQGIATLYAHRGFQPAQDHPATPVVPPPDLEDLIQDRSGAIDQPGPAYQALLAPPGRPGGSGAAHPPPPPAPAHSRAAAGRQRRTWPASRAPASCAPWPWRRNPGWPSWPPPGTTAG